MAVPRPSIGPPTSLRAVGDRCGFPARQAAAVGGSYGWCGWQAATGHRSITASDGLISLEWYLVERKRHLRASAGRRESAGEMDALAECGVRRFPPARPPSMGGFPTDYWGSRAPPLGIDVPLSLLAK
jgi:hypothetical protein